MYLPQAVSSADIEALHGLPKGCSLKYSGVANRHQATTETPASMAAEAGHRALTAAELSIEDVDVVITAGASFDQIIPSQAASVLSMIPGGERSRCEAFHVNTTCLSFVTAFALAADKLQHPEVKRVLVIASEIASKGIGPENWETLTLFGDGSAAVLLEESDNQNSGIVAHQHKTYTEGIKAAEIPGGGVAKWIGDYPFSPELHHFQMDGRELLRLTIQHLPHFMEEFFEKAGTTWSDMDWTVPHQASKTGLGIIPKLAEVQPEKVVNILENTGNCIAASIPMALHDLLSNDKLKFGQSAMMCGTSAGYAIGALIYRHG